MPENLVGICHGSLRMPHPLGILVSVADGSARRVILRDGVPGFPGGDTGGPSSTHHIQCDGGRSGLALVSGDGRASG